MKVTAHDIKLEWKDLEDRAYLPDRNHPRSKGVHVSELIRSIAVRTGILRTEKVRVGKNVMEIPDDGPDPLVCAVGIAWEELCASMHPDVLWQPGEIEVDGVFMTPDGVNVETGGVEEFKATWKSSSIQGSPRSLESHWMYVTQVKNYCKGMETGLSRVHVLYVNGDWGFGGKGPGPVYRMFEAEFTRREIESNWEMIMREKERIVK